MSECASEGCTVDYRQCVGINGRWWCMAHIDEGMRAATQPLRDALHSVLPPGAVT